MSQRGVLLFGNSIFTIQRYKIGLHYDTIDVKDTDLVRKFVVLFTNSYYYALFSLK
jgi:hypothetical protein